MKSIGGRGCALVADDSDFSRTVIARLLEHLGYEALQACDGAEAVEIYQRRGPSIELVLLDYEMPRMNGVEVYRRLKEMDRGARVIMCSGSSDRRELEELVNMGLVNFIPKPFGLDALTSAIDKMNKQGSA